MENTQNYDEILDDEALAIHWKVKGTPDAIKKKFQRLRHLDDKHPRKLKSFPVGGSARYRMSDILEYEARAKNFLFGLARRQSQPHFESDLNRQPTTDELKALHEWLNSDPDDESDPMSGMDILANMK